MKGAGGPSGGVGQFFLGLVLAVAGSYLLMERVTVASGFWSFFGDHGFGLTLLPMVAGVGVLFFDGESRLGWALTLGGALIIFLGVIMNLRIYFAPTSLFNTIMMLFLLGAGLGLVARSLKAR